MKQFLMTLILGVLASPTFAANSTKIRLGWQVPWTVQGQLVQILKHTDILKRHQLEVEFLGKTMGPELNELALSGAIDILLTADQPAAILFAKSPDWQGIGRLMYNRTSTYVPPESPIRSIKELDGKTVGVPFGAAAQRVLADALHEAKIETDKVKLINLGMLEHGPLIRKTKPNSQKWDQFDALSGFDPIPALLEAKKSLRTIHEGKVCALVVGKRKFLMANSKAAESFLAALGEAYEYYRSHKTEANRWFTEEARLEELPSSAAELTEKFEPNLKNGEKIRLSFREEDYPLMQKGADFVKKVTGKTISMKDFVTNTFVPKAYH